MAPGERHGVGQQVGGAPAGGHRARLDWRPPGGGGSLSAGGFKVPQDLDEEAEGAG